MGKTPAVQNRGMDILGVRVDDISKEEVIAFILLKVRVGEKAVVSNVNVHAINLARKTPWFRDFLNGSDIVFCDGFGVKFAAAFLYHRSIKRFTPPDWLPQLIEQGIQSHRSFFFLGGRPGVAEKADQRLAEKVPGFRAVGMEHGYLDKTRSSAENKALVQRINMIKPDILVVGFGMPLQEKWIRENLDDLDVRAVLPVGAAFDYLAGETRRAPAWMTDHGLEWLGRLLIEPGRLWKRYILGNPIFIWRVIMQKLGWIKHCTNH